MLSCEILGSRDTMVSIDQPSKELLFSVMGSTDDIAVCAYVETQIPSKMVMTSALLGKTITVILQSYQVKQSRESRTTWEGVAKYGRRQPRQTGDLYLQFDATGGTAHVAVSKETMHSYARSGQMQPPGSLIGTILAGGDLTSGVTYNWVVTAIGNGESLQSNTQSQAATLSNRSGFLRWNAVTNATSYKIYRSTGAFNSPCLVGTASGTTFIDSGAALQAGAPPATPFIESPPSFNRCIGVNNDTVAGTDVRVPVFKFTLQYYAPMAVMTPDYIQLLASLDGVNNAPFMGFPAKTVLYLGTTGQPRGLDDWELTMHFIASPNVTNLSVGDILNIVKDGHDYLWVRFGDAVNNIVAPNSNNNTTATTTALTKIPRFAFVERVYEQVNYSQLGLDDIEIRGLATTIAITPDVLPDGAHQTSYSQAISTTGGAAPVTLSYTGTLPTGYTLANGVLSGTTTDTGTFSIIVTATDANGATADRAYNLTVS